jgi:exodeoxyribonuclease VII small subunit
MKKEKFEDHLEKVETAVRELEGGEMGLEESFVKYEEAVKSLHRCYEILDSVEKKVQILKRAEDGTLKLEPFVFRKAEDAEKDERGRRSRQDEDQ